MAESLFEQFFDVLSFISLFTYTALIIGIFNVNPDYAVWIRTIMKLIISFVLMYKFNPLQPKYKKLTPFEQKLAFSAAGFILIDTVIGQYLLGVAASYGHHVSTRLFNN